ncbi:MAG: CPBP family intramembrane metalloprotease [Ruminococcus sp.]|nr:CPBP family intramembrane metalloprotease [Ruminococcus sp.]
MSNKKKTTVLIFYFIIFYALWAVMELIVRDSIDSTFKNAFVTEFVKEGVIKNLLWTLPAIALIKYFKDDMYISLKEMISTKVNVLKYLPVFIIFTIFLLCNSFVLNGKIAISENFGMDDIIIFIFVGLTEEMVFRGWLLNATIRDDKKWQAVLINSLMFLVIHFPIWIHDGIFITSFTSFGFVTILILSIIFSWSFIKSRNILVPIALHTYWDLLVSIFS